jgi:glutamate 5-kinase
MMVYQKIFAEYNTVAAQVLMTKSAILDKVSRMNVENTFKELLLLGTIPIVNENDTVSTSEIEQVQSFGDNDRLAAIVSSIIGADLLILLSDIDGLFTDDPNTNSEAKFIEEVPVIDGKLAAMGKSSSGSNVGTGGMATKIIAAKIATQSGADMVITNGDDLENISKILNGENIGTLFLANESLNFDLIEMIS